MSVKSQGKRTVFFGNNASILGGILYKNILCRKKRGQTEYGV